MEKNKKLFGILSLVLALVCIITQFFGITGNMSSAQTITLICLLSTIASVIFGIIGIKSSKGLSIAGIVIGIIAFLISLFTIIGLYGMSQAKDCVDNYDGTSTCNMMGQEVLVPNNLLNDEQMKEN